MPLPRLLVILIGLCVILGFVLWLVNAIQQLYWQVTWTAPFLGNLVLLLVIALLGALLFAFVYYFNLFGVAKKGNNRRRPVQVSQVKAEAAEETLRAVRKQVSQIQGDVARQALLEKSREIAENLARGELLVVVFGTGSAGKTSLINALMGRVVGEVGAPMGTTEEGATYTLRLRGLQRDILITDTPGILEAGVAGGKRERMARRMATEADLLLFVVDDDLRQSEYDPLRMLVGVGKRSLVIFNKADRYPDADREAILGRLRQRLQGLVEVSDVVPVSANPPAVQLADGDWIYPEPDVMPLIQRMAAVLRSEGEDLIADNMLLQAQRLGEKARKLIDSQRRRQADKVVERYQWIGAGAIAVTPLPVVDLLATAAVNAQMIVELGKIYGCDLSGDRAQELALSLAKTLTSLGIVKGAIGILTTALQFNLATAVIGKGIQGVAAAYLTRIAGKSFTEYFRNDQDWGDGGITEVVQKQFQLNKRDQFIKLFVKEAISKVVKPLGLEKPLSELSPKEGREMEMQEPFLGENNPSQTQGRSQDYDPPPP
ncbi:MAG: GTP-binding protein [Cyanobacteria bacterium P01_C01_bin.89]